MKLGIIGANSNVGTELSFLFKNNFDVIPITRNQLGSIFLKYHDFPCRISDVSNEIDAKESLSDLNSVIICSYAIDQYSGSQTRSSQKINEDMIKNIVKFSNTDSTLIYFSTIRTFSNNIVPNTSNFGFKSSFEKEKIHLEKLLLNESQKNKKRAFILRMSQVFGENQPRTRYFRDSFSKDKVVVNVSPEKISNIVHTVTVKDAIMKCLDKKSIPGIYSLVNNPQWTWKNVIDFYKQPNTIIEYQPKPNVNLNSKKSEKNKNGLLWNLLKSNKKHITPFLYYVSPKFEPQIQKKLAEKKMLNAKSRMNNLDNKYSDQKFQSFQNKTFENIVKFLNSLNNDANPNNKIPEELIDESEKTSMFNIEEFEFNTMPGPFLDNLYNTKKLLDNCSDDMVFR